MPCPNKTDTDATQAFLQSLPELRDGQPFRFACHPGVRCFNACCGDLNLVLTPYDTLRLRQALGEDSKTFISKRCHILNAPDTGFPLLALKMLPGEGKPCPFVTPQGCSVYENRPGACRTYPLGRAARLGEDESILQQFFVVQEPHCKGFDENVEWTADTWLADQGLADYNRANDRFLALMGRQKKAGSSIDRRQAGMAFLGLYQPDRLQGFIGEMRLFERLEVSPERQQAILADEDAALAFGLDWLELTLFGQCPNLNKRETA